MYKNRCLRTAAGVLVLVLMPAVASGGPAPPIRKQRFIGALQRQPDGNFAGRVEDLGACRHNVTLETDVKPWRFVFPSGDTCHDPTNVEPLTIELFPSMSTETSIAGFFQNRPACWLPWGSGTFSLTRQPQGSWWLVINGIRGTIDYHGCRPRLHWGPAR